MNNTLSHTHNFALYECMYICLYLLYLYTQIRGHTGRENGREHILYRENTFYIRRYADTQGGTIESEELQKWILDSHPRSRTEAYPLYLLTKDVLKQVATDKCLVINSTLSNLRAELARQAEAMALGERAAEQARQQLLSQIQDLEHALQDEVKKPKGGSAEDVARLAQLDETQADMKRRLDTAVKDASKALELAEKAKKDTEMYKKEHNTVTKLQQDTAMKLKRAEATIASLQSGAEQDPLDSMTDDVKCVVLKRLRRGDLQDKKLLAGCSIRTGGPRTQGLP
jgi:chaperonin cofactor prefoldin